MRKRTIDDECASVGRCLGNPWSGTQQRRHCGRRRAPAPFHVQARQGHKKRGRYGTKYSKFHPENYLSHHLSAISMAAVYADACHIDDGVTGLKQDAHAAGSSDEE